MVPNRATHHISSENIKKSGSVQVVFKFRDLTHYMPVLPSYRNQLDNLHRKSTDWGLYEGNTGKLWVQRKPKMIFKARKIRGFVIPIRPLIWVHLI